VLVIIAVELPFSGRNVRGWQIGAVGQAPRFEVA
jgi:hypothetical protein